MYIFSSISMCTYMSRLSIMYTYIYIYINVMLSIYLYAYRDLSCLYEKRGQPCS